MKTIVPAAVATAGLLLLAGLTAAAPARRACPAVGDVADLTRGLGRTPDNMLQARDHFVTVYGATTSEERLSDGSLSLVWAARPKAAGKANVAPGLTITIRRGSEGLAEVGCSSP